jgi:hypothetical protein
VQPLTDWAKEDWRDCLSQGAPRLEATPKARAHELAGAKYSKDEFNRKR